MIKTVLLLVLITFTVCVKQENLDRGLKISTHPRLGEYLTDQEGRSLYMFDLDTDFTSNCYDDCARLWLPYVIDTGVTIFDNIKENLLGRFTRSDGQHHLTYNKLPLYFYDKDMMPGDVLGHGLNSFGGRWFLMSPTGTPIRRMLPRNN
jgi:predicted lipoprotein with Yx(FWY)xxD motif